MSEWEIPGVEVNQPDEFPVSESGAKLFQVVFDLDEEKPDWPPVLIERLWGEKTAKLELRVVNTPFFVRGIAYGDLIRVRPDHERRELVFDGVMAESGHSTVRLVVRREAERDLIEAELRAVGCGIGTLRAFGNLIAVDVPPAVDYGELREWFLRHVATEAIGIQESAISADHRQQVPEFP